MTKTIFSLVLAAMVIVGSGCEATNDFNPNSDSDADTDTDTDTDTDSDSDGDGDSDSDSDGGVSGDGGVIDMDCTACPAVGPTMENMLCAIDLCDFTYVVSNDYLTPIAAPTCALEDTYEAVNHFGAVTNGLAPQKNDSYALMASGTALGTSHSLNLCGGSGLLDPWTVETTNIYDVVEWQLVITAPSNAQAFRMKYVFFSEEYDDYIMGIVNDKFYIILQAGSTDGGNAKVINFTECRDPLNYSDFTCQPGDTSCTPGEEYCFIAINSALSECCWYPTGSVFAPNPGDPPCPLGTWTTDISGTGFECATDVGSDSSNTGSSTGWLQTAWPITGGETFVLTFHIHDTGDGIFDSEVILDSFEFLATPEQGTTPIE